MTLFLVRWSVRPVRSRILNESWRERTRTLRVDEAAVPAAVERDVVEAAVAAEIDLVDGEVEAAVKVAKDAEEEPEGR
jgi:hypothetical protein